MERSPILQEAIRLLSDTQCVLVFPGLFMGSIPYLAAYWHDLVQTCTCVAAVY